MNMTKEQFLSNSKNKQRFMDMFSSSSLRNFGVSTIHASDDADLLIVTTVVDTVSSTIMHVAVIGKDTDLLILLLGPNVFMTSDKKFSNAKVWPINEMKEQQGEQFCENLLFMHAFLGCDTTSRIFSIGKGVIVKKFKEENSLYLKCAEIFNNMESSVESIIHFGGTFLVSLLGEKADESG